MTDQIAVGGYVPGIINKGTGYYAGVSNGGTGDVVVYAQYKVDKLIDPRLFSLTGHVSVELPTGDQDQSRDRDKFGVRPLALAYKDFGRVGPGRLGAYGLLGFTITDDAHVRWGLAATYECERCVGVLELTGNDGSDHYGNVALFTPGLVYRGFHQFELAVGIPIGLTNDSPDVGVTAKVTYALPD